MFGIVGVLPRDCYSLFGESHIGVSSNESLNFVVMSCLAILLTLWMERNNRIFYCGLFVFGHFVSISLYLFLLLFFFKKSCIWMKSNRNSNFR